MSYDSDLSIRPASDDLAFASGVERGNFEALQAILESVAPGFRFGNDRRFARFLAGESTIRVEIARSVFVVVERDIFTEGKPFAVGVAWSAIGDVAPERAASFAADVASAASRAETIRAVLRSLPSAFSDSFLAFVAANGLPVRP